MEQRTSVEHVNFMPQAKPSLSRGLQTAVSENMATSTRLSDASEETASGLNVQSCVVDGAACTRVEWRIQDPMRKLRVSCGFPIVSPEFAIDEGRSLRIAFNAGQKWATECGKASAKSKKRVKKTDQLNTDQLPLHGSLQLKTLGDFSLNASASQASFSLGDVQQGQLELADRTVQGIDLVTDWRTQIEGDDGRDLRVSINFVRA